MNEAPQDDALSEKQDEPEPEDTAGSGNIEHPFDPNKIRVRLWSPTVYNLMQRLHHGELDLAPEFQRLAGIWDETRQSRLIESLLIRIPLPAFYLSELPPVPGQLTERFAVVDGVQRLTVLHRFINMKNLRLTGLEFLGPQLEGKNFDELDSPLKRRIQETQLAVNVVEPGTPDEAKLNVFKRINTGGVALNAQEIRHAMNPGPVRKWLELVAGGTDFREAVGDTVIKMALRMEDRECVIRFVAFLDSGFTHYRDAGTDFDTFLHRAMARVNDLPDAERDALQRRFERAARAAGMLFGRYAFRKMSSTDRRGRVNKALFEATMVALDARSDAELTALKSRTVQLLQAYKNALQDPETSDAVSFSTGDPRKVERRFAALAEVLAEALR